MEDIRATLDGGFWGSRQDLVRKSVLPYQWKAMNDEIPGAPKSHSLGNFRIAAGRANGDHDGMVFQDSDLYKWLEAAGNVLGCGLEPQSPILAWVDEATDLIAGAQQPDGYINTYFTLREPGQRWRNLRDAHELYCSGHLIEAAVSLARGGNRRLLDVAMRLADLIDRSFGVEEGKHRGYPGHEEVELALVKLYRLTGERRYLERARYFVDERGRTPSYFLQEATAPGFRSVFGAKPLEYYQAHRPIREQTEAVGHAVRAMYLYTAMADIALETGDAELTAACDRLWHNTTARKMYITGGIGSSASHEAFTAEFDLPNDTAYAETCAAIGLFLFSSRMVRLHDEARYADVMERCLYNGILSGLALDGQGYFYVNPLEVAPEVCDTNGTHHHVKYRRQPWYGCACCPPNVARTLSSLGDHVYHRRGGTLFADLYHDGALALTVEGVAVTVRQRTGLPWTGDVELVMEPVSPVELEVALRVPGWCAGSGLTVNGDVVPAGPGPDGYLRVRRTWKRGDTVSLALTMTVDRMHADPRVRSTIGKVALQRGPLIYCLEEADNGKGLHRVHLPSDALLVTQDRPDLLGGVTVIKTQGETYAAVPEDGALYAAGEAPQRMEDRPLIFIPYYAWANRVAGEMAVWIHA